MASLVAQADRLGGGGGATEEISCWVLGEQWSLDFVEVMSEDVAVA